MAKDLDMATQPDAKPPFSIRSVGIRLVVAAVAGIFMLAVAYFCVVLLVMASICEFSTEAFGEIKQC